METIDTIANWLRKRCQPQTQINFLIMAINKGNIKLDFLVAINKVTDNTKVDIPTRIKIAKETKAMVGDGDLVYVEEVYFTYTTFIKLLNTYNFSNTFDYID